MLSIYNRKYRKTTMKMTREKQRIKLVIIKFNIGRSTCSLLLPLDKYGYSILIFNLQMNSLDPE